MGVSASKNIGETLNKSYTNLAQSLRLYEKEKWDDQHDDYFAPYSAAEGMQGVYQDMTAPLAHYWISSGHNSYLTGNQLNSKSGTETIIMCLRAGCRVIELDVFDKPNGLPGPVCKHGGTLTKPVLVKTCLQAIVANAFIASKYPVIITIENHTHHDNQLSLAALLVEVLGKALYIPDPDDPCHEFKSPEQLQHKILVRGGIKKDTVPELAQLIYLVNTKFATLEDATNSERATTSSFMEDKVFRVTELQGLKKSETLARAVEADEKISALEAEEASDAHRSSCHGSDHKHANRVIKHSHLGKSVADARASRRSKRLAPLALSRDASDNSVRTQPHRFHHRHLFGPHHRSSPSREQLPDCDEEEEADELEISSSAYPESEDSPLPSPLMTGGTAAAMLHAAAAQPNSSKAAVSVAHAEVRSSAPGAAAATGAAAASAATSAAVMAAAASTNGAGQAIRPSAAAVMDNPSRMLLMPPAAAAPATAADGPANSTAPTSAELVAAVSAAAQQAAGQAAMPPALHIHGTVEPSGTARTVIESAVALDNNLLPPGEALQTPPNTELAQRPKSKLFALLGRPPRVPKSAATDSSSHKPLHHAATADSVRSRSQSAPEGIVSNGDSSTKPAFRYSASSPLHNFTFRKSLKKRGALLHSRNLKPDTSELAGGMPGFTNVSRDGTMDRADAEITAAAAAAAVMTKEGGFTTGAILTHLGSSLQNSKGKGKFSNSLTEVLTYTNRHLMRTYPAGRRVRSDNYNPMRMWNMGASIVALNWQVWDTAMRLNETKFKDNGGCGYVRKPDWMIHHQPFLPNRVPGRLTIHVLCAHKYQGVNMCCWRDDLFVLLEVRGMPIDTKRFTTHTVVNSGRLVVDKSYTFTIYYPELALLMITLMDEDLTQNSAQPIAYTGLPLNTLRTGRFKLSLSPCESGTFHHGKVLDDAFIKVDINWGPEPSEVLPQPPSARSSVSSIPDGMSNASTMMSHLGSVGSTLLTSPTGDRLQRLDSNGIPIVRVDSEGNPLPQFRHSSGLDAKLGLGAASISALDSKYGSDAVERSNLAPSEGGELSAGQVAVGVEQPGTMQTTALTAAALSQQNAATITPSPLSAVGGSTSLCNAGSEAAPAGETEGRAAVGAASVGSSHSALSGTARSSHPPLPTTTGAAHTARATTSSCIPSIPAVATSSGTAESAATRMAATTFKVSPAAPATTPNRSKIPAPSEHHVTFRASPPPTFHGDAAAWKAGGAAFHAAAQQPAAWNSTPSHHNGAQKTRTSPSSAQGAGSLGGGAGGQGEGSQLQDGQLLHRSQDNSDLVHGHSNPVRDAQLGALKVTRQQLEFEAVLRPPKALS